MVCGVTDKITVYTSLLIDDERRKGSWNQGEADMLTKVQTRTQGDFAGVYNVSDDPIDPLSLTVTAPAGTLFVELNWEMMIGADRADQLGFVVTKGGVLLPDSVDGSNNPWSCLTTGYRLSSHVTDLTQAIPIRIFDDNPTIGSPVVYEIRARNTSSTLASTVFLNYSGVPGASNKEEGMSTGRAIGWN